MNRSLLMLVALLASLGAFAQQDTTRSGNHPDTVHVGNFIIIKKNRDHNKDRDRDVYTDTATQKDSTSGSHNFTISIGSHRRYHRSIVSTNWLIFDLGFANWNNKTDYAAAQQAGFFKNIPYNGHGDNPVDQHSFDLNNFKSSNVNIWLFMQKLNITSHMLNLKYGLGLEMFNYRFDSRISFRNEPEPFVYNDSISFKKNKLYVGYVTIPLMLNFNSSPYRDRGFSISAGISAGYRVGSRNKQVSQERGKVKYRGNLDLEDWRVASVAEIGFGPIRLYGSYALSTLFKKDKTGLEQYPYTMGIRFSNW
ncbi:outer membrane beta-barrel protein [Deminuibacter soli]|uniref:Uncharacterized protein n=1 Tax=Deminuibacter soli TaxID=2291815 RepID=A0A3E1NPL6_9BACT|nr:outer membrane beta-barrel protein [Deminuibacter soli]RFM29876.1 hypothetical protein DXN05_02560 [Deminuibacter soli]